MKTPLLLPALLLVLLSCRKDDPLPAATQSGANTFGCKVNGKAWIPDGAGGFAQIKAISGGYVGYSVDSTTNNIFISTYKSDRTKIDIYLKEVTEPGLYQLNQYTGIYFAELNPRTYGAYFPNPGQAFATNPEYTGTVNITRADTVNSIISGTFEFTVYDPDSKQTIRITDGRFDIDSRK